MRKKTLHRAKIKTAVKRALGSEIPEEKGVLRADLERAGIKPTVENGIAYAMVMRALSGEKQAVEWVREVSSEGEKQEDRKESAVVFISGEGDIPD